MGLLSRKPDHAAAANLMYWHGEAGAPPRCFVDFRGDQSMRGHLPMAALESLTVFTDHRTERAPIDEVTSFLSAIVIDTEAESSTYGYASMPPGGPVFVAENAGGEDWWAVSFMLDGSKRKRLFADVVVWNSDVIDTADPVVQAKVAEQAWFDYTRWLLNEAGSAGIFIVLEINRLIEMHVERGRFPRVGELGKVPFLVALENQNAREAAKSSFTNPRPL